MKNLAIILSLLTMSLFSANCGAKAEKNETKPSNVSNSATANAPQLNTQNKISKDNDGDSDDIPVSNPNNNSPANNGTKKVDANDVRGKDADDLRGKDADDVRKKSVNANTNSKVMRGKDRDDLNKKGDADDRWKRRDNDGDGDDY